MFRWSSAALCALSIAYVGTSACSRDDGTDLGDAAKPGSTGGAGSGGTGGGGETGGTGGKGAAGGQCGEPGGKGDRGPVGAGGGTSAGTEVMGSAGTAGRSFDAQDDGGSCYTGTAPPPTWTLEGRSFGAWEGEPVTGCLLASQSFPPSCSSTTVINGGFSMTGKVCTAWHWDITVGRTGHQVGCGPVYQVTPADCWCRSGLGPDPGAGGGPGVGCDAGEKDAVSDAFNGTCGD
jgi:hypothetical protein